MRKKWIAAFAAMLLVSYFGLWPFESLDAGTLFVVETMLIEESNGQFRVSCKDLSGTAGTVQEAVAVMAQKAPGTLFLRQAKRIVFCEGAEKRTNLREMPEELPVGVIIFKSGQSAKELGKEFEKLEKRLEARERENDKLPTLAKLQNEEYISMEEELSGNQVP